MVGDFVVSAIGILVLPIAGAVDNIPIMLLFFVVSAIGIAVLPIGAAEDIIPIMVVFTGTLVSAVSVKIQ